MKSVMKWLDKDKKGLSFMKRLGEQVIKPQWLKEVHGIEEWHTKMQAAGRRKHDDERAALRAARAPVRAGQ